MDQPKKPSDLEAKNTIGSMTPGTRGRVLAEYGKELTENERLSLVENLVESAMTLGITDVYAIRNWLGTKKIPFNSLKAAKVRILRRWKSEAENVSETISQDRAKLISAAWKEVQECENLYEEAEDVSEKVKVKALKRDWLQFISKLSFVDKLIEANEAPMNIIIHDSDISMEEGNARG
jgi:hypothetical protein